MPRRNDWVPYVETVGRFLLTLYARDPAVVAYFDGVTNLLIWRDAID